MDMEIEEEVDFKEMDTVIEDVEDMIMIADEVDMTITADVEDTTMDMVIKVDKEHSVSSFL